MNSIREEKGRNKGKARRIQEINTENLRLCDRRIPFLLRLRLAEMDGCNMAVVTQIKDLDNC